MAETPAAEFATTQTSTADVQQATLEALQAIARNQPRRRLGAHEIVFNTPFWDGKSPRSVLKRPFYQNGTPVNDHVLTNEEIDLLNQVKTGLYNHKKWQVRKMPDGGISLDYSTKSLQNRFDIAGAAKGRGLAGILQDILTEREAQDERMKRTGNRYESDADDE